MEAIAGILEHYSPDIICLQEVRQDSLRLFLQTPWARNYTPSRAVIGNNRHYGEIVFSKYPLIKTECFPFRRTLMSRHVNVCDISIPVNSEDMLLGHNFTVVTAHLESMPENHNIRREQIKGIFDMMQRADNVFFLGDTNFFKDDEFSPAELPPYWKDTWKELADAEIIDPTTTEYTYDAENNKNADGDYRSRIDRVFYKSVDWVPTRYELVGTDSIEGTKLLYPSDHYGIYVEFSLAGLEDDIISDEDVKHIGDID
jgi:tyrosyl-DNA phosphodiesterase 2